MITAMYDTFQIFRRELQARRQFLWAGLAVSALAIVLPFVPSLSTWHDGDVRDLLAVALALGAGVVLSIGFGTTVFGSDLSEGRLGFFFERPVASPAIWLGRFLAVLVLVVLCELIILAPAGLSPYHGLSIVEFLSADWSFDLADWVLVLLAGPALLLLVSHCISIMVRARSVWLVLDFLGFTVIGPAIWLIHRPLVNQNAVTAAAVVSTALGASVFVGLLAGTAASISCGRTDLRRAHRFLSVVLWAALSVTLGATAAYATWLVNIDPADFDEFRVLTTSPDGAWIDVSGTADGHLDVRRRYLLSADGQKKVPLPPTRYWRSRTTFSSSGNRAMWLSSWGFNNPGTLWHVDLDSSGLRPVESTIMISGHGKFRLSPDGRRMAVIDADLLSVYELEKESLIATARVPDSGWQPAFRFPNPNTVRFLRKVSDGSPWPDTNWSVGVSEIFLDAGGKRVDHDLLPSTQEFGVEIDPHLQFCVTGLKPYGWRDDAEDVKKIPPAKVFDATTGEYKKSVRGDWGDFLSGGGFWSTEPADNGDLWLIIQPPEGDEPIRHNLGIFETRPWIFELPGRGMVIVFDLPSDGKRRYDGYWDRVEFLDIETGDRHLIGERLRRGNWNGRDASIRVNRYGFAGSDTEFTLFQNEQGVLLVWDPEAGQLAPILGETESD